MPDCMPVQLLNILQTAYKAMPLFTGALVSRSYRLPDVPIGWDYTVLARAILAQDRLYAPLVATSPQLTLVRLPISRIRLMHERYGSLSRSRLITKVVGLSQGRNAPLWAQTRALSLRPRQPGTRLGRRSRCPWKTKILDTRGDKGLAAGKANATELTKI